MFRIDFVNLLGKLVSWVTLKDLQDFAGDRCCTKRENEKTNERMRERQFHIIFKFMSEHYKST